jgi:hypothetical protein
MRPRTRRQARAVSSSKARWPTFNRHSPLKVDFKNDDRAPLLLIGGGEDQTVPAVVDGSTAKHYRKGRSRRLRPRMGGRERQDLVAGLTPHDPITGAAYQSRERTPFFDVARLHRRCSGPCQRNGSWSTWPRSQGVPRSIRRPHRAHKTPPPATFRAQPARNALCLAPYFSITAPSRSPGKSTPQRA